MVKIRVIVESHLCSSCGWCVEECASGVLTQDPSTGKAVVTRPDACTGCSMCVDVCGDSAIRLVAEVEHNLTARQPSFSH